MAAPRVVQVAMCSADLPHTLRLYTEVFGFADAGGRAFWGPWLGVQALGPDAAALVWWLVGRQDFVQLEVFHHTTPAQRPLPDDWRPSDHGWVRWGLAVPDFDAALERLRGMGIATLSGPAERDGLRRACFSELLHDDASEALWGLEGAECERFVVSGGDVYIEVVRYDDPPGRPRPPDSSLSDQGLMNLAVGFRERAELERLYERIVANGYRPNAELMPGSAGGTYLEDADGNSFEVLAVPREFDPLFGFTPGDVFDPHAFWPQAGAPPAEPSGS